MIDNKVKNTLLGNPDQQKCPFCGKRMEEAMHCDINFASEGALSLMCLSILHFLIHAFDHIRKVGHKWTVKQWNKRNMDKDEIARRTEEVNDALFNVFGLPSGAYGEICNFKTFELSI